VNSRDPEGIWRRCGGAQGEEAAIKTKRDRVFQPWKTNLVRVARGEKPLRRSQNEKLAHKKKRPRGEYFESPEVWEWVKYGRRKNDIYIGKSQHIPSKKNRYERGKCGNALKKTEDGLIIGPLTQKQRGAQGGDDGLHSRKMSRGKGEG